uniref:Caffeoyl-CoA O-methyltransferase n=1 Tax=Triticum urartu TaxID=4572 RepID=A0A8R7V3D6_TRIUA
MATTAADATAAAPKDQPANGSEQVTRHSEVGHKSLLQSDALYQYILETSVYPREHECMKELREITANHPWNLMTTSADEGQFLNMLLKLIGAAGGRGQPRHLRLRLRGRRQGQLPQLPRAPHEARQARRPPRLRQHALERLRRAPRRR